MRSIAVVLRTETKTRLTSTAVAPDNGLPAELPAPAVRQVSAVGRVLPEEQAIDLAAEQLEISEQVIVLVVDSELEAVRAAEGPAIVLVAEPDLVAARERGIVPAAVRVWARDPVPV
jgi:peptide deformylase